jgi:carbamoylphosphate synthase small subunit
MTESLSAVRQEYESLMFERTKQQKVYDGAEELFDYGLTPPDILHMKEIIQASGIECRSIMQNLVQYGSWTNALHQIKTEVGNLKSEHDELSDRVSNLKALEEKITCKIESKIERQMKGERDFENHIKERVTAMAMAIKKRRLDTLLQKSKRRKEFNLWKPRKDINSTYSKKLMHL